MRLENFQVDRIDNKLKIIFVFYHKPTNARFYEEMWIDDMIGSTPKNLSKSFNKWTKWLKRINKHEI